MELSTAKTMRRKWSVGIMLGMCCLTLAGCVTDGEDYDETPTYNRPSYYRQYENRPRYDRPRYDEPRYERPRYDQSRYNSDEGQERQRHWDRDERRRPDAVQDNGDGRDHERDQRRFRRFWMQNDD
ncbi:hypothetical protein EPK99_06690 [Neorhizobium lilium]|uniref:Lipoprotein n=1 Tax=Neorhizobium lilium TaxID=2503024 RepID=A0A3S3VNE8_9HYPH|nr:hypothetical protein [Neorhizobium lilium]RWX78310.1 hypothetical protein EPK99_06690 [Neorhizobium lilium]